jgi:hypothetical protein
MAVRYRDKSEAFISQRCRRSFLAVDLAVNIDAFLYSVRSLRIVLYEDIEVDGTRFECLSPVIKFRQIDRLP